MKLPLKLCDVGMYFTFFQEPNQVNEITGKSFNGKGLLVGVQCRTILQKFPVGGWTIVTDYPSMNWGPDIGVNIVDLTITINDREQRYRGTNQ